jgi:tRNA (adenine-N(1)-)-methyltransferase non-catalytic subunit
MNFKEEFLSRTLSSLNWSTAREDYNSCTLILHPAVVIPKILEVMAPDLPVDQYKSDKHKIRIEKRRMVGNLLTRTREDLFAGEFDG